MKLRLHDWTMKQDVAQVEGVRRAMGDDFIVISVIMPSAGLCRMV